MLLLRGLFQWVEQRLLVGQFVCQRQWPVVERFVFLQRVRQQFVVERKRLVERVRQQFLAAE